MKLLLPILLLLSSFGLFSQKEITWDDLKFKYEHKSDNLVIKFNRKQKDLDSVKIIIQGFVTPVNIEDEYFVLSKNIYQVVGFCRKGSNEMYEVIELRFMSKPSILKNDVEYWIEGTLILNDDDILQLNYILKDAVIVEK